MVGLTKNTSLQYKSFITTLSKLLPPLVVINNLAVLLKGKFTGLINMALVGPGTAILEST
jgi:hypothetical protein